MLDEATGQTVVVPDSFTLTEPTPVAPWLLPRLLFEALSTGPAPKLISFVFFLSGAFEIILESGAVAGLCGWVVGRFRHRRGWLVPLFVGVFSLFGFTMGLTTASIIFVPLGMAAARSLGYDARTGMAMVMLGTNAGFAAGGYNPFSVGIAQAIAELCIPGYGCGGCCWRCWWRLQAPISCAGRSGPGRTGRKFSRSNLGLLRARA